MLLASCYYQYTSMHANNLELFLLYLSYSLNAISPVVVTTVTAN